MTASRPKNNKICTLVALFAFTLGALLGLRPLFDYDLYWHLANGREMLAQGSVINHEVFSYTHQGEPFLYRAWLAQIIWYLIWISIGPEGLLLFKVLVAGGVAYLVFRTASLLGATPAVAGVIAPMAVWVGLYRYIERPELFSLMFLALLGYLLARWRSGASGWKSLSSLPIVFMVWDWVNGAFFGYLYLAVFVAWVGGAKRSGRIGTIDPAASHRAMGWAVLATIVVCCLNPWGILTYADAVSLVANPDQSAFKNVMEYRASTLENNPNFFFFSGFSLLVLLFSFRQMGVLGLALMASFGFLTLEFVRITGAFAIAVAPFVAAGLSVLLKDSRTWLRRCAMGGLLIAAGYSLVCAVQQKWPGSTNPHGIGWGVNDQYLPVGATEFAKHLKLGGNLYNTGHFGGYLAFNLYPEARIFQYNFPQVFGDTYRFVSQSGLAELESWNIQYAFVANAEELRVLFPNHAWARIYRDTAGVLVVRRSVTHQSIIALFESHQFHPMFDTSRLKQLAADPGIRKSFLTEGVVYLAFRNDERIAAWMRAEKGTSEVASDPRYKEYVKRAKAMNPQLDL